MNFTVTPRLLVMVVRLTGWPSAVVPKAAVLKVAAPAGWAARTAASGASPASGPIRVMSALPRSLLWPHRDPVPAALQCAPSGFAHTSPRASPRSRLEPSSLFRAQRSCQQPDPRLVQVDGAAEQQRDRLDHRNHDRQRCGAG